MRCFNLSKKLNINEIASLLVGGARQGRVGHEMNDKKKVWQVQVQEISVIIRSGLCIVIVSVKVIIQEI